MQYRPLGLNGPSVSVICLGTMTWGEQNTRQQAHDQLDFAVERGVNFFDTAEGYAVPMRVETQGETERIIGDWLARRQDREKLVVATKACGPADRLAYVRGGPKLNREHLRQAVDGSLQRLQTDYIDLYQIHWPARSTNYFGRLGYFPREDEGATPIRETLAALHELVLEGKIRRIGLSNETPWGIMHYLSLAEIEGWPKVVSVQNPYNLLNRSFEIGIAEISHREHVGLLAYSPLAMGALSGKYRNGGGNQQDRLRRWADYFPRYMTERAQAVTARYCELAEQHEMTPSSMALAFVNSRPWVTSSIIGATTLEQLSENIASAELKLPKPLTKALGAIHADVPNPCP